MYFPWEEIVAERHRQRELRGVGYNEDRWGVGVNERDETPPTYANGKSLRYIYINKTGNLYIKVSIDRFINEGIDTSGLELRLITFNILYSVFPSYRYESSWTYESYGTIVCLGIVLVSIQIVLFSVIIVISSIIRVIPTIFQLSNMDKLWNIFKLLGYPGNTFSPCFLVRFGFSSA